MIIQDYEKIKALIDENKNAELNQELQKGTFRWSSRMKTICFPTFGLLEIIICDLIIRKIAPLEEFPELTTQLIKDFIQFGGTRWFFVSMIDAQQAQSTSNYLNKNKKTFEKIIEDFKEQKSKDDKQKGLETLKNFLSLSHQSIFTELGSFILFDELFNFTKGLIRI